MSKIFFLFIILSAHSPGFAQKKQLKLRVVGEEFAPFEFIKNGEVVGIDIDIAKYIFDQMNISVEFNILPWKRAWSSIVEGKAEAVLTTSRSKKREPYLWYPEENMWISNFVFFVHKDKQDIPFEGYKTILVKKWKVGIIDGNSYHPSFWKAFPYQNGATTFQGDHSKAKEHLQLHKTTMLNQNLKMLAKKRIDIFLSDKTFGNYSIKILKLKSEVTYYDKVVYSKPYPMAFSKKSKYPNLKKISLEFDFRLKKLKKTTKYQDFFDKWLK
ncbi:MAG: transporter substrate-binding domain-containing protein [Halobacteriovoraceae bacterium]|nr:transporter substrate-binding domain-containing protein [Halobacteriovoraceae bacterium]